MNGSEKCMATLIALAETDNIICLLCGFILSGAILQNYNTVLKQSYWLATVGAILY
jgi:hypothetical protein